MKTVVLDDDPTGTQSASNVTVLLDFDADLIAEALTAADSVYIQTNSRAIDEDTAIALVARVRDDSLEAGRRLGQDIQFVLRGDSTLRGHVFAETEQFLDADSVIVFVPAFPDGGRTTRDGVHYVQVNGQDIPAHESEYALDPVFGFSTAVLTEYVREKSGRSALAVPLDKVRDGSSLAQALAGAAPGTVVLPDAVTNDDIRLIARAIEAARSGGTPVVVRSAAPLAAALAGVESTGLLSTPLVRQARPTLLVCGSHTIGATVQLARIEPVWGTPETIDTDQALTDPAATGKTAAEALREQLAARGLAMVASSRNRAAEHNTLDHGEKVMTALTTAVHELRHEVDVVISKGGITSADVARVGLAATRATVLGQILPGVSVWSIDVAPDHAVTYVVVPGNVGAEDTLEKILHAAGF